jgi:hypothetical protein
VIVSMNRFTGPSSLAPALRRTGVLSLLFFRVPGPGRLRRSQGTVAFITQALDPPRPASNATATRAQSTFAPLAAAVRSSEPAVYRSYVSVG